MIAIVVVTVILPVGVPGIRKKVTVFADVERIIWVTPPMVTPVAPDKLLP